MLVPLRPRFSVALTVFIVIVIINILASVITLILMIRMWKFGSLKVNLYVKCVMLMTICQLLYDASLIPIIFTCAASTERRVCTGISSIGFSVGGSGAAIWSIIILASAVYTIEWQRKPSSHDQKKIFVVVTLILIGYGIPYYIAGYNAASDIVAFGDYLVAFNYLRLALIGVSFLFMARMFYLLYQKTLQKERFDSPLYHLCRKLIFYPIVQCVTRLGTTPYDILYHSTFSLFPENAGSLQTFLCYLEVVLAPSAGMGAFFVFLYMQTGAASEFIRMLKCDWQANVVVVGSKSAVGSRQHSQRSSHAFPGDTPLHDGMSVFDSQNTSELRNSTKGPLTPSAKNDDDEDGARSSYDSNSSRKYAVGVQPQSGHLDLSRLSPGDHGHDAADYVQNNNSISSQGSDLDNVRAEAIAPRNWIDFTESELVLAVLQGEQRKLNDTIPKGLVQKELDTSHNPLAASNTSVAGVSGHKRTAFDDI